MKEGGSNSLSVVVVVGGGSGGGGGGGSLLGGEFSRWGGEISKFLAGGGTAPIPPVGKTLLTCVKFNQL